MTVRFDFDGDPPPPRDAATVLVVRDGPEGPEVLLLRRSADVRFMGGAYVFPGGRVDEGDADPRLRCDLDAEAAARRIHEPDPRRALALHVAAIRECVEESGVLLAQGALDDDALSALRGALSGRAPPPLAAVLPPGLTLLASALTPLTRWVTPKLESRRYDARFFIARAPESKTRVAHDGSETVASAWMTPREAIARALRHELVLAPPTWRTLAEVAHATDVAAMLALAPPRITPREPVVLQEGGEVIVALPDDPAHPEAAPRVSDELPTRFRYDDGAWIPA